MRDVDVPDEIIRAHRDGELVLFVGAGASVDPPSSLPTFLRLTEQIASASGRTMTDVDRARPDRFLGGLDRGGVDVHGRVAALLQPAGTAPNALHRALADLVGAAGALRAVTTNYDLHLTSELGARQTSSRYTAPALPVGDDFTGIVHLHGALDHPAASLVVTDGDFGRAYLTDAWAARFLERMFSRFVVLFVGYSHEDVVMTYLARGLGAAKPRFAFTDKPESSDWPSLGIQPVGYRVSDGGGHDALRAAIEAWASRAAMGLLDHRAHIAGLVTGQPSEIPQDVSYLEDVLEDPQTVGFFTEFARDEAWLTWAATRPTFRSLFDPAATSTPITFALARWFVAEFVMVETRSELALDVLAAHNGRMSPELWHAIGGHLHGGPTPRPSWLNPWLTLLLRNPPEHTGDWLEYALVASQLPDDRDIALLLFDHLTEPHPSIRGTFGPLTVRTSVSLDGNEHWLREAWNDLLRPNLGQVADDVLSIGDHHLRRAHQLLRAAGVGSDDWDPISYRRRGIEPNKEDAFPEAIDVVIDATRDAIVHLVRSDPTTADAWLSRWEQAASPMLRRLVTHAWTVRTDKSSDEKLQWLKTRNLLYTVEQHHDTYQLLTCVGGASDTVVANLVADALAGPQTDSDYRNHAIVNLLAWLAQHASDNTDIQAALDNFRNEHPDVEPRTHLDYLSWSESGSIGAQPPMTTDELHSRLESDAASVIADLVGLWGQTSPFDGPTWHDVATLIAAVVRQWPLDGFQVIATSAEHVEQEHDIARAVIEGWSTAELPEALEGQIIALLLARLDLPALRNQIALMLGERRANQPDPPRWPLLAAARPLATRLWEESAADPTEVFNDHFEALISHWASNVAEFWIQVIAAEWRADQEGWSGLTEDLRQPLDEIVGTETAAGAAARSTFITRLHFFFTADQEWTTTRLLPALDWAHAGAQSTWSAFIAWGRWSEPLLNAGLFDHYVDAVRHIHDFDHQVSDRLLDHVASVALQSDDDRVPDWITTIVLALNDDTRPKLWHRVSWLLREQPPRAIERRWTEWMEPHWRHRLQSVPLSLTTAEASAMATWVPRLGVAASAAIDLTLQHDAGIEQHSTLLHDLARADELVADPQRTAEFVAHLLKGTASPFYGCYDVARLIKQIREKTRSEPLNVIEQALRLGCPPATWEEGNPT